MHYTLAAWRRLRLCGYTELTPDDDDPGGIFEMRDCLGCGSTISIVVTASDVDPHVPYAVF